MKNIGWIILALFLLIVLVSSTWNFMSKVVHKDESELVPDLKKVKVQDEIMNYRLKSQGRGKQIQTALSKAGFYNGEIDGKIGPQTRKAIKEFQKSKGLKPDGMVGPKTWETLSKYLD